MSAYALQPSSGDMLHRMYSGHHGWLVQWLERKLGNSGDAADVAQDTYVRVAGADGMPDPELARPYLVQIAKNLMIDLVRRRKLEAAYLEALAAMPEAVAPSQEDTLAMLQTLQALDRALAALPSKVSETFFMSQFDGMTYSAIAEVLGIAVATVRKHMLTATRSCLAVLTEYGIAIT